MKPLLEDLEVYHRWLLLVELVKQVNALWRVGCREHYDSEGGYYLRMHLSGIQKIMAATPSTRGFLSTGKRMYGFYGPEPKEVAI